MGPLAAVLVPSFLTELFKLGGQALHDYQQGKITIEQLRTQLGVVGMEAFTKVAVANAEMVTKTFASFTELAKQSRLVRIVYAVVTLSQAFVLFWYQWAVPFIVWKYGGSFPPASDVLLEWGYGLLVLLVGGGLAAIKQRQVPAPTPPKG